MYKTNKKGFIQILLNPIVLILLVSGLFLLIFATPNSPFRLAIFNSFSWNGFNIEDLGQIPATNNCAYGGGQSNVQVDDKGYININAKGDNAPSTRTIQTDVAGVDELLVIYDGYGSAYCSNGGGNSGSGISGSIVGSVSGSVGLSQSVGTQNCPSGGDSKSATFPPSIWKFKNNFDGTWSTLQGLGVGDIFIVKDTKQINGDKQYLQLSVSSGTGCGQSSSSAGSSGFLRIYNIIKKENGVAQCKANFYVSGIDKSGNVICNNLSTIVLNSEEAIKESYNEKFMRLQSELEAKNQGLTADIELLKQKLAQQQTDEQITLLQQQINQLESQLTTASDKTLIQSEIDALRQQQLNSNNLQDQLNALQAELKGTKAVLADVQAKDKNVVNTVESQEKFERPNFIKEFFNKIIAWIKGLFG